MSEYEFNAERFCRVRARSARAVRNFDDEQNFLKVADRVRQLEYEVEAWKKKPAMNVQRKYDALREAARPVVEYYDALGISKMDAFEPSNIIMGTNETPVTKRQLDALTALVGEEG